MTRGDWPGLGEYPEDLQWEAPVDVLRGRVKVPDGAPPVAQRLTTIRFMAGPQPLLRERRPQRYGPGEQSVWCRSTSKTVLTPGPTARQITNEFQDHERVPIFDSSLPSRSRDLPRPGHTQVCVRCVSLGLLIPLRPATNVDRDRQAVQARVLPRVRVSPSDTRRQRDPGGHDSPCH